MSFLLQRLADLRISLSEVRGTSLRIGRGTNAQLRSENAAVALEHAVIEEVSAGWELIDRGSITGTYLNGRAIERSRVGKGDVIEVGDLRILVQSADPGRPLFLRVDQRDLDAEPEAVAPAGGQSAAAPVGRGAGTIKAKSVDFTRAFALRRGVISKSAVSWMLLLIALGAVLLVGFGTRKDVFQPGAISVAHSSARLPDGRRIIGLNDCDSCHAPFAGATDKKCAECHRQTFHQASLAVNGSCTGCHSEHRQIASLAQVQQGLCVECHGDLKRVDPKADVAPKITRFEQNHPEFSVEIRQGAEQVRLAVTDARFVRSDPNSLKFNHRCHLTGDCGFRPPTRESPRRERETLSCAACHDIDPKSGTALPVSYEKACARCHVLTFDNRFPPVPHGVDLPTLAGVIANAYGGNTQLLTRSASEVARIFASRSNSQFNVGSETVRNAQKVVKVRCLQCHVLDDSGQRVVRPDGARSWFRGVRAFSHTDHLAETLKLRCIDCHDRAAQSTSTRDLSLPTISDCTPCHRDSAAHPEQSLGRCLACHYYHELTSKHGKGWTARAASLAIPVAPAALPVTRFVESGSGSAFALAPSLLRTLVIGGAAVIALIAGIIIVGLVLRQVRRRRGSVAPAPTPRAVSAPQPAAPPPSPAPPPRPAAPPSYSSPATVASSMDNLAEPTIASGTEMLQWQGTLFGVTGAWKGKRVSVPDVGFYIGRDKQAADIVIESPKISRRHVWVGVKDGKVVAVDEGSTNGTFINDPASARITEIELKPGDVIILGEGVASFRFDG
jgi:predicted CXXCH cytochrome family protein